MPFPAGDLDKRRKCMSRKSVFVVVLVISAFTAAGALQPSENKGAISGPAAAEPTPQKSVKTSRKHSRRKFDHIGNKQSSSKVKPKPVKGSIPKHYGADMLEESNIRQENPTGNGANNQPNASATSGPNSTPVKGSIPKHFGADMMEGSNIRQENPTGNPPVRKALYKGKVHHKP
jgi:hypothetical protein